MRPSRLIVFAISIYNLTGVTQQLPLPTESQITGIEISANSEQIENAEIAKNKSASDAIKRYAMTVLNERKAANKAVGDVANVIRITPEENESTKALKKLTKKSRSKLKRFKGPKFDKAYVDGEVELQQFMLDLIDRSLIPGAQNPILHSLISNDRPLVEARLKQALELQSHLK